MRVVMRTGEPFALAGLWSVWRDPDGNRVPSCAIITTAANELLRPIHDRMPVVLPKELEEFWLDASVEDAPTLTGIMASYPASAMEAFEVSRLVNSVANDAPEVVAPVATVLIVKRN